MNKTVQLYDVLQLSFIALYCTMATMFSKLFSLYLGELSAAASCILMG